MYHPLFPFPDYVRDEPAARRLLAAAARLRRQAHYHPRHRDKLLAVAERIEELCRRPHPDIDPAPARVAAEGPDDPDVERRLSRT